MKDFSEYAEGREKNARGVNDNSGADYGGRERRDKRTSYGQNDREGSSSGAGVDASALLQMLAGKYEGKSEDELLASILSEAQQARKNGNLSDGDIDNFARTVMPMLSSSQQKKLMKVIGYLKSGKLR